MHGTPLRVTPDTDSDAHVVRGITPPRLICPPVQVEDVESDDEDDDDDAAPQINTGSDVEQEESGAEAPPNWAAVSECESRQTITKLTIQISGTLTRTKLTSSTTQTS